MTLAIAIGNDPKEIENIQRTINLLTQYKSVKTNDSDNIDDILDWYKGIYNILTDVDLFAHQT